MNVRRLVSFAFVFMVLMITSVSFSQTMFPAYGQHPLYAQFESPRFELREGHVVVSPGWDRYVVNTFDADCSRSNRNNPTSFCLGSTSLEFEGFLPTFKSTTLHCDSYVYISSIQLNRPPEEQAQIQICRFQMMGQPFNAAVAMVYLKDGKPTRARLPRGLKFHVTDELLKSGAPRFARFEVESVLNYCPATDCSKPENASKAPCYREQVVNLLEEARGSKGRARRDMARRYFKSQCQTPPSRDSQVTCSHADFQSYQSRYEAMIELAALSFQVPRPLMKCLLFQESKWDHAAVNSGTAKGIAQFTEDGAKQVSELISPPGNEYSLLNAYSSETASQCDLDVSGPLGQLSDFQRAWALYHNALLANPNYASAKPLKGPWSSHLEIGIPQEFSLEIGSKNPSLAIGASAAYLKYMRDVRMSPEVRAQMDKSPREKVLLLAGAYNAGDGLLARVRIGRTARETLANFRNLVKEHYTKERGLEGGIRKHEITTKHMQIIDDCMKAIAVPPPDRT